MTIVELRQPPKHLDVEDILDVDLMTQIAQQERQALSILYDRYARLVYSIAFHLVGDDAITEEITMEVFLRVWEKASTYHEGRAKVSTWLTSITRNMALDWLRKQKVRRQANLDGDLARLFAESSGQHTEHDVERSLKQQAVREALCVLPAEQFQVIELTYYRGYTQQEIAELLQIPVGTVKSRTRLAMEKLRQVLGEYR